MKYNLADPTDVIAARSRVTYLVRKQRVVDIKAVNPKRSLNQNSYLHLLIGYFGVHFGYTIPEAKAIYKELNASTYAYEKNNRTFWRSSADLNTEEMTKTIDIFRERSAEHGCPLPTATDQGWLKEIENEIERSRYYL